MSSKDWQTSFLSNVVRRDGKRLLLTFGYVNEDDTKSPFFRFLTYEFNQSGSFTFNIYQARVIMGCLGKILREQHQYSQDCGKRKFTVSAKDNDIVLDIAKNESYEFNFVFNIEEAKKLRHLIYMLSKVCDGGVTSKQIAVCSLKNIIGHMGPDFETAFEENVCDITRCEHMMHRLFGISVDQNRNYKLLEWLNIENSNRSVEIGIELTKLNEYFD